MNASKTGSVRRRWTPKQRQRFLARFNQSQLTQRKFAAQHAIGMSTLSKWLRLEREAPATQVKFQELRVPNAAPRWPVEVVNPQGWIVRLQDGADVKSLPELLRALPF